MSTSDTTDLAAACITGTYGLLLLALLRIRRDKRSSRLQYDVRHDTSLYPKIHQRIQFDKTEPSCVLFGGPIKGEDKWLGGEKARDGVIYGVPGSGQYVLKIDPRTGEVKNIGPKLCHPIVQTSLKRNAFKWLRGICASDGNIYGVPSNADSVLKIDPRTDEVTTIGGPLKGQWKWHGGVLANDGNIYGIPCNAETVLKINPTTGEVTTFGGPFKGQNKWYGGLLARDGCIYGIPNCADRVIKIDPATQTATTIGDGAIPLGGWKWHGGVVGTDGTIYGMPSHADSVVKIVPSTGEVKEIGGPFPESTYHKGQKRTYKYGGGVVGTDGCVYALPSDADSVIKIIPETEEVRVIGPRFSNRINKWQNGFTGRDGAIYAIPCDADAVLKIVPETEEVLLVGGPFTEGKEKWEGGVVGDDGAMYCVPQQSGAVLKIDPAYLDKQGNTFAPTSGGGM
jgi:hypothetical protein